MTIADHIQREHGIVGRAAELEIALAVISSGRHLLLEGPVGVGKTTVALAVCDHLERATIRIDGDERYTENKLTGWFDPPIVLREGYGDRSFFPGPLVQAMREGAVLFINELNRMPESVQNVLLPALDEGLLILPRIGEVRAVRGFQVVATQNPVEYIATGHLSEALKDRFEHVPLRHQPEEEEREIVRRETGSRDEELVVDAVAIVRRTRSNPRFRKGASVRAAVSIVSIAEKLPGSGRLRSAALTALATRVELQDEEEPDLASAIDEILLEVKKKLTGPADASAARAASVTAVRVGEKAGKKGGAGLLTDALGRLAAARQLSEQELDGWAVAEGLSATTPALPEGDLKELARRIAARTVLRRAHDLVGPIQPSRRVVRETLTEPFRGELDEETTLENLLGKEFPEPDDWVSARREARRTQVVLMMDTSLSMSGKNLALAAVAAAVLAFSVRSEDLAVVAFETTARALTHLGQRDTAARVVEQLFLQPARGFTNIARGLEVGRRELARARTPRRVGLLITDGVFTAGDDPISQAALFPRLFVLLTEDFIMDGALCARMARVGNGSVVKVNGYEDLPSRMLHVVTRLLR